MKTNSVIAVKLLTAYLFLVTVSAYPQGNIVLNGSFEAGGGSFNNWNAVNLGFGPSGYLIAPLFFPQFPVNYPDGVHCAVFTYNGASISQTLSTTPGTFYSLNFSAIQYDGTNRSSVSVNGGLLATLNFMNYTFISPTGEVAPGFQFNSNWENFSFTFAATTTSTTILFSELPRLYNTADNTAYYSHGGLDAISVTVVPDPSTVALLGAGLAGWLARRRLS